MTGSILIIDIKGSKMNKRVSLSLLSLVFVTNAYASNEVPKVNIGSSVILVGYNDSDDMAYKVNLGYSLSKNYSIEFNYFDFGESDRYDDLSGLSAEAYSVEFLAKYPINNFSLYVKLGSLWWKEEGNRTLWWEEVPTKEHIKNNGNDTIYGAGISYNLTKNISLKIEFQQSLINSRTENPVSLGFDIQF